MSDTFELQAPLTLGQVLYFLHGVKSLVELGVDDELIARDSTALGIAVLEEQMPATDAITALLLLRRDHIDRLFASENFPKQGLTPAQLFDYLHMEVNRLAAMAAALDRQVHAISPYPVLMGVHSGNVARDLKRLLAGWQGYSQEFLPKPTAPQEVEAPAQDAQSAVEE